MKAALATLVLYEKKITVITSEEEALNLAHDIHKGILQLKNDDYVLIPGGWGSFKGRGHTMIYRCCLNEDGDALFIIENSGAGLEFHEKKSDTEKELYNSELTYKIPKEKIASIQFFPKIIAQLLIANLPRLHKQEDIDENYLYQTIFPQFAYINGEIVKRETQLRYSSGQLSGTCAMRAVNKALQPCFENHDEYRRFIVGFKLYALDKYIDSLKATQTFHLPHLHPQIKKAIYHDLKLLNLCSEQNSQTPLFSISEKQNNLEKLNTYLQELKQFDTEAARVIDKPNTEQPSLEWTWKDIDSIDFANFTAKDNHEKENLDPPININGGSQLFHEMDLVIIRCAQLQEDQQYAALFEQLEHFFLKNLLVTHDSKKELDAFYSKITSEADAFIFYKKINLLQTHYFDACSHLTHTIILPRMHLVECQIFLLIEKINQIIRLSKDKKNYYHYIFGDAIRFLRNFPDSVYFANHDPEKDTQSRKLKEMTENTPSWCAESLELIKYYMSLLKNYPALVKKLELSYLEKYDHDKSSLHQALRDHELTALYYFTEHIDQAIIQDNEEFFPLLEKFKLQEELEKAYLTRKNTKKSVPIKISYNKNLERLDITSTFLDYQFSQNSIFNINPLSKTQYDIKPTSGAWQILQVHNVKNVSSNIAQLLPTDQLPEQNKRHSQQNIKQKILDETELENRELIHIRRCESTQILLTINYFNKHIKKTNSTELQTYIIANFFQPGLLKKQLSHSGEKVFFETFDAFIENGLSEFKTSGQWNTQSQFFIHLAYKVNRYVIQLDSPACKQRFNKFHQELNEFIENTKKKI